MATEPRFYDGRASAAPSPCVTNHKAIELVERERATSPVRVDIGGPRGRT